MMPNLPSTSIKKSHKDLFSTNDDYNPELNRRLTLLYRGGFDMQQNASLFLQRIDNLETERAFASRCKATSYIPYLSEFATQFSSSLFSEPLEVKTPADADDPSTSGSNTKDDFYSEFINDCDGNGTSFHQFMQDVFDRSLYELQVYIGKDFPRVSQLPNNLLEEEALGLSRGYAFTIPYDNVIDWKIDPKTGKFIWVKIFSEILPDDDPYNQATHFFQFKIWQIKNGKSHYTIWNSDRMPIDKGYTQTTLYSLDDEGSTSFPDIPISVFSLPKGYHVGLQIGPICQEHYQRRSFLVSNSNKTCVALGVVKLGSDIPAPGDALPADIPVPDSARVLRRDLESEGWTVIRHCDDIEIIEAKGEAHRFVSDELKHLVEQMMQTLRQMNMTASANQKAVGRSAASKLVDQHGTSMLLSVYERRVKDFCKLFFTQLAAGRNERIHWTVEGLSISVPVVDREALISELTKLGVDIFKLPDIFKSKYLLRSALELLDNDASDIEKLELQSKIEDSVSAGDFDALEADEALAANNKMAKVNLV